MKKSIIIVFLAMVISFNAYFEPVKVEAFVLTATATTVIVITTLLAACGVTYASSSDAQTAANSLYNKMSEDMRTKLALSTVIAGSIFKVGGDLWHDFCDFVTSIFSADSIDQQIIDGCVTKPNSSYNISNLDVILSISKTAGSTGTITLGSSECTVTLGTIPTDLQPYITDTTTTFLTLNCSNGATIYRITSYGISTSSTNKFQLCTGIIIDNNTYKTLTFPFKMPISSDVFHTSSFGTMYLKENGILYKVQTAGSDQVALTNMSTNAQTNRMCLGGLAGLCYNYVIEGIPISIPVDVDEEYFPSADSGSIAIPADDTDVISFPYAGTIEDAYVQAPSAVVANTAVLAGSIADTIEIPETSTEDETSNKFKFPSIFINKFPFCIPFDIYNAFRMLSSPPQAPKFDYDFVIPSLGVNEHYSIDFTQFETLATVLRWFLSVLFMIILIVATRGLIKG